MQTNWLIIWNRSWLTVAKERCCVFTFVGSIVIGLWHCCIYAIRNGVEVLYLEFIVDGNKKPCFFLPFSLHRCGSLRYLTLDFIDKPMLYWDLPSSIPLPNLQFFSSKCMRVNDGSSFGEWISSWPNIKEINSASKRWCRRQYQHKSSCFVSSELRNLGISGERLEKVVVDCPTKLCNLSISGERASWKCNGGMEIRYKSLKISSPDLKE